MAKKKPGNESAKPGIELIRVKLDTPQDADKLTAEWIEFILGARKKTRRLGRVGKVCLFEIKGLDPIGDLKILRRRRIFKKTSVPSWAIPPERSVVHVSQIILLPRWEAIVFDADLDDGSTMTRAIWLRILQGGAQHRTAFELAYNGYDESVIRTLSACAQTIRFDKRCKTLDLIDPSLLVRGKLPDLNQILKINLDDDTEQTMDLLSNISSQDISMFGSGAGDYIDYEE